MRIHRFYASLGLLLLVACLIGVMSLSSCSGMKEQESQERPKNLVVYSTVDAVHDPLLALTSEQQFLMSLESRSLFSLSKSGEVRSNLAHSYTVSDDGTKTIIQLSENTFTDGSKVTSSDVKATLSRIATAGGEFSDLVKSIKGVGEAKSGGDFFGVTTPDELTVSIELIAPDPFFVYHLAHPATSIIPARSIDEQGSLTFDAHSGEYTADELINDIDSVTTYVPRNRQYPTIQVIRKTLTALNETPRPQDVDIVLGATQSSDNFEQMSVHQLAVASWNLYVADGNSPLANVRFRQAILMALDQEESIAAYSTRALIPTRFTGNTFDSVVCSANCETNVKKAKVLLSQAFPDSEIPAITIDIENNDIQKELASSAQRRLAEVGIPATIEEHDSVELSNVIARGEVQLFRFGWVSDVAVGADPLVMNFKADSTEKVSGITDETLEKNITSYVVSTTAEDKKEASRVLQERLKDLWLMRPIAQFRKIVTVNRDLSGVTFDCYSRADIGSIRES